MKRQHFLRYLAAGAVSCSLANPFSLIAQDNSPDVFRLAKPTRPLNPQHLEVMFSARNTDELVGIELILEAEKGAVPSIALYPLGGLTMARTIYLNTKSPNKDYIIFILKGWDFLEDSLLLLDKLPPSADFTDFAVLDFGAKSNYPAPLEVYGVATGFRSSDGSGVPMQLKFEEGLIVGVREPVTPIPSAYQLLQNYPNPVSSMSDGSTIEYRLGERTKVVLEIYNLLGQRIGEPLVDRVEEVGLKHVRWNPANLPSGVYFYKLSTRNYSEIKKMIVVK